jgi:uncharacterized protein (DUF1697 family)
MQTYIAILRGINVNGKNIIKMDKLLLLFQNLGFEHVKTYIQSGNVVFQSKNIETRDLEKLIQNKILENFDCKIPILVIEKSEWNLVANNNPFVNQRNEDTAKLHVTFLSEEPNEAFIEKIKQGNYDVDEFFVAGKAIYLFCPNGYGNTKLSNNFFENKLKITATTRNWKTVNELKIIAEY